MPHGAGLLVAVCVVVWSADASAQTAPPPFPDPFAPNLQTDPRQPPRFQKSTRPGRTPLGPPMNFSPPGSGAGVTGFDSTNARKKIKPRLRAATGMPRAPASDASAASPDRSAVPVDKNAAANTQAIAPGLPAPLAVSRYQKPVAASAGRAFAQAPGTPPVELGPIRRPPKKRKAHSEPDDPYAPLGVHAGAFTLFPAVELIGGYDSNPARVQGGQSALLYTIAPELQVQSNWSRHELKADLRGSYTGYSPDATPTLSRPNVNGKVDGRIDVTRDTRIDLSGRMLVATDNPGSPNLQAGLAKLPVFATFGGSAGIGQRFNRLELSIKGDVERTVYQDSSLTDGTTASNEDRQYNQYTGRVRVGYELSPGVKPFIEASADTRVHDLNTDFAGYQRNSKGLAGLIGTSFDLRGTLTGEAAFGYAQRTYEDPRLDKLSGLIGEASLIWTANALTTVKLSAKSSIGESTIPGVAGVFSRDVGLQLDHSFRRWLIGSVKLGFGLDSYRGGSVGAEEWDLLCECVVSIPGGTAADRVDKRYFAGLGLTYKLNRSVQVKGEFQQNWLRSNVTGSDYTASVFLLGLRFQR
jgi:hypothetical protein